VATERNYISVRDYGRDLVGAAPPSAIGAAVTWLLSTPEGAAMAGTMVDAQALARMHKLHPAWD